MRAPLRVRTQVRVLEAAKGGRRPAVICAVLRTKLAGTAELKLPKEQVSPQSMASSLCTEDILSRISLYGGGGGVQNHTRVRATALEELFPGANPIRHPESTPGHGHEKKGRISFN